MTVAARLGGGPAGIPWEERPPGSASKLRTFRDGWRILLTITNLMRNERPLLFFSLIGLVLLVAAVALGIPILVEYARTGLVPRYPTAILCTGLVVISFVSIATGLILDLVSHVRRETKRLAYLGIPAPRASAAARAAAAAAGSPAGSARDRDPRAGSPARGSDP